MKKLTVLLAAAFMALIPLAQAQAHSFWINSFESHAHQPPHAMLSLGWGHMLPMDDLLNSPNGRIVIDRFEMLDPAMEKTELYKPKPEECKPSQSKPNFDLYNADMAVQKIAFKKDSKPGLYQLAATSKPTFYTQYIDKNDKPRLKLVSKDKVKDAKKILMAVKYEAFAKSYVTLGQWTNPKPLGHGLEIIPQTDLSNVRVGDLVEVQVLFYGKPLSASASSVDYITASSSSFGQPDKFQLSAYVMDGRAQFRVQSSGQWVIGISHKGDVTKDGPLKDLYGKANQVYHGATLTFNAK